MLDDVAQMVIVRLFACFQFFHAPRASKKRQRQCFVGFRGDIVEDLDRYFDHSTSSVNARNNPFIEEHIVVFIHPLATGHLVNNLDLRSRLLIQIHGYLNRPGVFLYDSRCGSKRSSHLVVLNRDRVGVLCARPVPRAIHNFKNHRFILFRINFHIFEQVRHVSRYLGREHLHAGVYRI